MEVKDEILKLGDPMKVAVMLNSLGVNMDDFKDPGREARLMEIIEYLHGVPDPEFFVMRAVGNKQIDRVDFIHQYIGLQKDLKEAESKVGLIRDTITQYEK